MSNSKQKSLNTALLGLFSAIVIVLQFMSYFIKLGTFSLSLVLIPIVLGAVMYGVSFGAILGAVFGIVTYAAAVAGIDGGGHILFESAPFALAAVCIIKGAAAGAAAGLISKVISAKNQYAAAIAAAVAAPIVNTGIFIAAMFLVFKETLTVWANGASLGYYAVFGLLGINFIIEFCVNAVLSPVVFTVTEALKRYRR